MNEQPWRFLSHVPLEEKRLRDKALAEYEEQRRLDRIREERWGKVLTIGVSVLLIATVILIVMEVA